MGGQAGLRLRRAYWRRRLRHLGEDVLIGTNVRIYHPEYVSIGDGTWIDDNVIIRAGPFVAGGRNVEHRENPSYPGEAGEVHIGAQCHIAPFTILQGHGGLWIGDACGVATGSQMYSVSHHYRVRGGPEGAVYKLTSQAPAHEQSLLYGPVFMGDCSTMALQCIMLPGSSLGARSLISPMSMLSGALPEDSLGAGNPAQVVRSLR